MARAGKRSVIPDNRLRELSVRNAVYEVRCGIQECPCERPAEGCRRGFFSLFIQAVNGIEFARRIQKPYHINFGNCMYSYTDIDGGGGANFWNYYFKQPVTILDGTCCAVVNDFIEIYPLRIWSRSYFKEMSERVVSKIEFKDDLLSLVGKVRRSFDNQRILGVHYRGTDHHEEVAPVHVEDYLKAIDKRMREYDKLFLATDSQQIVDLFKQTFGSTLIINAAIRSDGPEALHSRLGSGNGYKLGLEAILDCYSLSICSEAILTHSNLSYAALFFNPNLKYKLMERWRSKVKRLKTLILYNLDKRNIRKW